MFDEQPDGDLYGKPAFPRDHRYDGHNGIDQRAYFAAKALQGLCANPGGPFQSNGFSGWGHVNCTNDDVAALATALADATLLQLAATARGVAMQEHTGRGDAISAWTLAQNFHRVYERLAPSFGYETRPDTRGWVADSPNGKLMRAVCEELMRDGWIARAATTVAAPAEGQPSFPRPDVWRTETSDTRAAGVPASHQISTPEIPDNSPDGVKEGDRG